MSLSSLKIKKIEIEIKFYITHALKQKLESKENDFHNLEKSLNDLHANKNQKIEKLMQEMRAYGPLVKWATAQIQYAEILHEKEPLSKELKSLKDPTKKKRARSSRFRFSY